MKKFINLLYKELRELITIQLFISLAFMILLFSFMGEIARSEAKKAAATQKLSVLNLDNSELSSGLIGNLKMMNFKVEEIQAEGPAAAVDALGKSDSSLLVVIPAGFGESVNRFEPTEIQTYTFLRSLSLGGLRKTEIVKALISTMNNYISNEFLKKKVPDLAPDTVKNPIKTREFVIVNEKKAEGSATAISGFVYSQSIFVPIILMMIIMYSSQLVISAIAMEKQNKTLETLLTVPIKRTSIVAAKMLASGAVGLFSAIIYMVGFKSYIGGMTSGFGGQSGSSQLISVIKELGLALTAQGYVILGISLFLAILCALALAIILGVLAEDFRSAQTLILPILLMILIPYFLSFFADVNNLSLPVKILVWLIPFSHPFIASQNILLNNYQPIFYGILYMLFVFSALVLTAARIFSTDRVLTMKLKWRRKKIVL